jgi:hypothetical protein
MEAGNNMDASAIAKLIGVFNVAAISIAVCFAVVGLLIIISKVFRFNILWLGRVSIVVKAFCIAGLTAFALEATVFNFFHYLKYFAGPQTGIIVKTSETGRSTFLSSDGTQIELGENGIRFNGLNRRVTSVFVEVGDYKDLETVQMAVEWTDEMMTQQYTKRLYKYLPYENYAPLQPCGNVSELAIAFSGDDFDRIIINDIQVNKPIPFYFSGLRILVVLCLFVALFALVNKNLREKAAYYLFECKFDPKNKKQNIVYACTVILLILFSSICVYTSVHKDTKYKERFPQYHKYLVSALIAGRTYLDYGNPEKLLAAEHPYNHQYRIANGYNEVFDVAWYKGRYYCYFGVVPAALLYVPYKMITGNYLTDYTGVFLFGALAVVLLALLWRYCVKKYMPNIRYALYLLALPTLFLASGISISLRFPTFYSIVQCAGYMFNIAGVLLLLKSVDSEKINYLKLFFACLCLALVFGCRPNMGLASLLVPVVLWKKRSWKLCAFVILPYILVAVPLCVYNYVRFESIFDFGATYNLTGWDMTAYSRQNILSKIFRVIVSFAYYLFCPNKFSMNFPFVSITTMGREIDHISLGVRWFYGDVCGMINFPIVFCLLYLFKNIFNKNRPNTFYVLSVSLVIAAAIIVLNSIVAGVAARYWFDFATLIILPSLFCAYYWCQNVDSGVIGADSSAIKNRLSLTYALIAVSIFVGLFISVDAILTYRSSTLYRYLEYSLGIFRDV